MAQQINNNLFAQGIEVDLSSPHTWKYYLNLSGQYHSTDTMMTVLSLDTKQVVNFTTDMLASHPHTAAAYVIGSSYYSTLCQTYPNQIDLIKSIVYPVDLNAAIEAKDFTLLGWGNGYLEVNEQDAIIHELQTFISYVATRWYFAFLNYETYYIWAFWASLWQSLPNAIFAARLKYLHTSSVHSFHIWSYLQSHGIADYSDILTSQQALFLYRNLNYLVDNKGKQSTLVILVNHLLNSLNVGLVGKTIYMNTATNAATCAWTPEFVSTVVPTNNAQSLALIAPESMTMINTELVAAGDDISSALEYVNAQQTRIGLTPLNILPTKLVEIQKLGIDQKYGSLLNTFILDTMIWALTSGLYTPDVMIVDPTTNITVSLSGKDALALYYYAVHRSSREHPLVLPTTYAPTCAFRPNITEASFPANFTYNGQSYPTRSYLSVQMLLTGLGYPVGPITDPTVFSNLVADLFLVLIRYVRYSRTEGNKISLEMFLEYCDTIVLQTTPYTFALSNATDYPTWITNTQTGHLITALDTNLDFVNAYSLLATAITTELLPENSPVYAFFAYTNDSTDNLYDRLKALFVQLCSYNICFLDTNRTNSWWFLYDRVVYTIGPIIDQLSLEVTVALDNGTIEQVDEIPVNGVATSMEVSIGSDGNIPIRIAETNTISITLIDTRDVLTPLTIDIQHPDLADTTYIPFSIGLQISVTTPV